MKIDEIPCQKMIAIDLYRVIIEYIAIEDLQYLCTASPIFDEVICKMGIKIFFYGEDYWALTEEHVIIKAKSGKKFLLQSVARPWLELFQKDIQYSFDSIYCGSCSYDHDKSIAIFETSKWTYIVRDVKWYQLTNHEAIVISEEVTCRPRYIDFDQRIIMAYPNETDFYVEVEQFDYIFCGNSWRDNSIDGQQEFMKLGLNKFEYDCMTL